MRPGLRCRALHRGIIWIGLTLLCLSPSKRSFAAPAAAGQASSPSARLSTEAWRKIHQQLDKAGYEPYRRARGGKAERGVWQASNRAHDLRATFTEHGIRVEPRREAGPTWRWGLELVRVGREGGLEAVASVEPVVEGNRVEYRRGFLTEWYLNDERGLEQGFTLAKPPRGRGDGAKVVLELRLAGELSPTLGADRRSLVLRDRRGETVLSYSGLHAYDAIGKTLSAAMTLVGGPDLAAKRLAILVDDGAAVYPLVIDPLLSSEVAELTALDAAAEDEFGSSVAISGDKVVVGAPNDDTFSGAAYVFEQNYDPLNPGTPLTDNWGQVAKLTASDASASDLFGLAVAISGDRVVVGAPFDDDACPADILCNSGSAYVFERNFDPDDPGTPLADNWGEVTKLTASVAEAGDEFGFSVAMSTDTVIVGAHLDDGVAAFSGSAYVFERNQGGGDAWGEVAKLTASDAAFEDELGFSVAIHGDRAVVGALRGDSSAVNSGTVYVFERNQGGLDAWGQVIELVPSDAAAGDELGYSVAIANDTVLVGARRDGDAGTDSGSAYLFERNFDPLDPGTPLADNWGEVIKLTASDAAAGDEFGFAVATDGDSAAVGARFGDGPFADSGSVYLFERNQGGADGWGEVSELSAGEAAPDDQFGFTVAMTGNRLVVGAPRDDDAGDRSGSAHVFARGGTIWEEIQKPVATDAELGDNFGWSVGISGDTVVVGAPFEDDPGSFSGAAYVFERNAGGADLWTQTDKLMPSNADPGDQFGISVAIDDDTIVVGSKSGNSVVPSTGSAYVFERNQGGAGEWGEVMALTASDAELGDDFGWSVAISGDTIVVGAREGDDACPLDIGCDSGAAYVFSRNQGGADNWGEVAKLTASDAEAEDEFGYSVAVSLGTVVAGAPFNDDACASPPCDSGSAYVFERNHGGIDLWGEVVKLTALDASSFDQFGVSVSIRGHRVVVGAPGWSNTGTVYVFERNRGGPEQWGEVTKLLATDAEAFDSLGFSVALDETRVLAGARLSDACPTDPGCNSGSAYIFERNQGGADAWGEVSKLIASDVAANDRFGSSVAISGRNALVGSLLDDDACPSDPSCDSGSAYIYRLRALEAELSITKDNGVSEVEPGDALDYIITVSNAGPEDVSGAIVSDELDPVQFLLSRSLWTCAPDPGSGPATSCPASGTPTDLASGVPVDIGAGDAVTFDVFTQVQPTASGTLSNTATVPAAAVGAIDSDVSNNSATDDDHILILGPCGFFEDRVLVDVSFDTEQDEIVACNSITAGPNVEVVQPGIGFRAGNRIALGNGFSVGPGAVFIATIDRTLLLVP